MEFKSRAPLCSFIEICKAEIKMLLIVVQRLEGLL